jgi:hypothetical protein
VILVHALIVRLWKGIIGKPGAGSWRMGRLGGIPPSPRTAIVAAPLGLAPFDFTQRRLSSLAASTVRHGCGTWQFAIGLLRRELPVCYMRYVILYGWLLMSVGKSGRIVLEVEPELKQRLYSALALENKTLKEWFILSANDHIRSQLQPSIFEALKREPQ